MEIRIPVERVRVRLTSCLAFGAFLFVVGTGCQSNPGEKSLPSYVQSELTSATEYQANIISDGTVTPAEYEAAVLATLACLDDHGIAHGVPQYSERRVESPIWFYTFGPYPEEDKATIEAQFQQCYDDYEAAVAAVWIQQEGPSEDELEAAKQEVVDCAKEHGLPVRSYADLDPRTLTGTEAAVVSTCKAYVFEGAAAP